VFAGCSKPSAPLIVLSSNQDGKFQFDYVGSGVYSYSRNLDAFSFKVERVPGTSWIQASGVMKIGESNDVVVTVHSTSKNPYTIKFKGLSKSSDDDVPEERAIEVVEVPAGNWSCTNNLFIIYTYDFLKR